MMMMMTVSDFYCFITDHHGCLAVVPLDGTGQKEKMVGYRPMTSHHPRAACRQKHPENSSPSGVRPRNSRPSSCYQTIGEWEPQASASNVTESRSRSTPSAFLQFEAEQC